MHISAPSVLAVAALVEAVVENDATAHAGAERQVDEVPVAAAGSKAVLAERGGVGVVVEVRGAAQPVLHQPHQLMSG